MFQIVADLPGHGILLIEKQVLVLVQKFIQSSEDDTESAGILIGEYRGNQHIRVVHATVPGLADRSTRTRFSRLDPHHQEQALSYWKNSNKTQTWIGEWHTHPEDHPSPSSYDKREWKSHLPQREMVLLIQGRRSIWLGLAVSGEIISLPRFSQQSYIDHC